MTTTKRAAAGEPETTPPAAAEPERVPAFKVGETTYTFPAHIPPGWALTYLRLLYSGRPQQAAIWSLARLLGDQQQAALERETELTRDDLTAAITAAREALLEGVHGAGS